ncbi:MAG: sensor histidine kinase [Leptolyngbyaceae cyanobacterium]
MPKTISIRSRISGGYAIVLAIAFAGTMAGLIVGHLAYERSLKLAQAATAERKLIDEIQTKILYHRPNWQLGPYIGDQARFRQQGQVMLSRLEGLQQTLQQHKKLHTNTEQHHETMTELQVAMEAEAETGQSAQDAPDAAAAQSHAPHHDKYSRREQDAYLSSVHPLLADFETTVENLYIETEQLVNAINDLGTTPQGVAQARKKLLAFTQGATFANFLGFADQLELARSQVSRQEEVAASAQRRAAVLQALIILGSAGVSVLIAMAVALYSSRTITRPLMAVTDVARRVTEENNFSLRAPVGRLDEVGQLATSLNLLIQQVKQLLSQVEQRNTDLSAALTQVEEQQIQLIQSEKMSSLGQLVAGVAHEINNPVNFIHGNLAHVRTHIEDVMLIIRELETRHPAAIAELEQTHEEVDLAFVQEDLSKILSSMRVGTDRIRQIVLSLRNFSRLDEAECKTVDLHEGLESSLMILQHRLKAKPDRPAITVNRHYGTLPPVQCYPGQLNQVALNILTNAIDAMEERHQQPGESQASLGITLTTREWQPGWVEIAIADTGTGMTAATREKLFSAFFTTKPEGVGTGIGMSISHKIITETHHGQLDCTSTVGAGTEFFIRIPIRQPEQPPEVASPPSVAMVS